MNKCLLYTIFLLFWGCEAFSQKDSQCEKVYQVVDEMPLYKKGFADLLSDVNKEIKFPNDCKPEDLRQIIWTINTEGKVAKVEVLTANELCKKELENQAGKFKDWKPGKLNGVPVCVKVMVMVHSRSSN